MKLTIELDYREASAIAVGLRTVSRDERWTTELRDDARTLELKLADAIRDQITERRAA